VLKRVTDLAGQILGIGSRICQDIRVSDLAVGCGGLGGGMRVFAERGGSVYLHLLGANSKQGGKP
jgi:hypothetical protein